MSAPAIDEGIEAGTPIEARRRDLTGLEDGAAADGNPDFIPGETFSGEMNNLTTYQKKLLEKAKQI